MAVFRRSAQYQKFVFVWVIAAFVTSISVWAQDDESKMIVPQTIRQPSSLDSRLAPHYHLFVSALQASGFKVGQTDDPRALDLMVRLDPNPVRLDIVASLRKQDSELLEARASGCVIYGNISNCEAVAQRAVKLFESKLGKIRDSMVIVADNHVLSEL